jgi:hypothetical protein
MDPLQYAGATENHKRGYRSRAPLARVNFGPRDGPVCILYFRVVPYNRFLCLKYEAHINVEIAHTTL